MTEACRALENWTAAAKYIMVGLSSVLCETTTSNEHFLVFLENVIVRLLLFFGNSVVNDNGKALTL